MVKTKKKGRAKSAPRKKVAKAAPKKATAKKGAKKPKKRATTTSAAIAAPAVEVARKAVDLLRSWSPSRYSMRR